jgi:hypothetical protein
LGQALAGGAARRDRGETLLDVTAVLLEVARHQGLDGGPVIGLEVAAADEVVGQGAGLNGETESVVVVRNELWETRAPLSRIGIRIGAETRDIRCEENRIEGFAVPISDLHRG